MLTTSITSSLHTTLHSVFESKALKSPDKVAIIDNSYGEVSYGQLLEKAKTLAAILRENGADRNQPVALMIDRSVEMMIGIYSILFSGSAYLPIDPATPANRVARILEIANARLMVTSSKYAASLSEVACQKLVIEDELQRNTDYGELPYINVPEDLAYVIFTSGSTGDPKGVMVEHRSVINRLQWMKEMYQLGADDVLLQKTPIIFDVSVWELFLWFFSGAKLYLLQPGHEKFPQSIIQAIHEQKVSFIHFIPSLLNVFLNYLTEEDISLLGSLKYTFCSGEALSAYQIYQFYDTFEKTQLVNFYGPTEATVDVTYYNVPRGHEGAVPIGNAIANIEIHTLDENGDPVVDQEAEIAISGIGLARGYINNKARTNESFFYHEGLKKRIYKTGDQGRITENGLVYFSGRNDDQVKIRGIRIELGEIENTLLQSRLVSECVVVLNKKSRNVVFTEAFVTMKQGIPIEELKAYAKGNLPSYMIPFKYRSVDDFPRLVSGKIDKKSLRNGAVAEMA